jgi:acetyl-CoA carboxylase biotin carboxyl carrier protein
MNLKELKELFKLVEKTDFREVEITHGELRVNIKRTHNGALEPVIYSHSVRGASDPVVIPAIKEAAIPSVIKEPVKEAPPKGVLITSPFVGTFYRAPAPDAKPFVDIGAKVQKGDTLCIVEAMKLMNEIEAEVDGVVKEIYPQNAQPVEFGAKLFLIEPA